tara:strand:+ start:281 stop:655 length:375 start_codon:yes stop_codon:yes gene_type:complete
MNDDITFYNKYNNNCEDDLNLNETKYSPMHPNLFYNLSVVRNFNKLNGHTYREYINFWKKRYNIIDIKKIKVVVMEDKPYQTILNNKAFINYKGNIILPTNHITTGVYEKLTGHCYHDLPEKDY